MKFCLSLYLTSHQQLRSYGDGATASSLFRKSGGARDLTRNSVENGSYICIEEKKAVTCLKYNNFLSSGRISVKNSSFSVSENKFISYHRSD